MRFYCMLSLQNLIAFAWLLYPSTFVYPDYGAIVFSCVGTYVFLHLSAFTPSVCLSTM